MYDLDHIRHLVELDLEARLQLTSEHSSALVEAMKYSVCGTAKRVRAVLVCAASVGFGAEINTALPPAAAIELIHAYSLVHDDLPDMDDSDTRRGQPSCHKQFGSTIAILAGDALQTLAFSTILDAAELTEQQRTDCAAVLANASGWRYMVGGQAMDMELMHRAIHDLDQLFTMHEGKTGALFRAALEMGAIVAGFSRESEQFGTMSEAGTKIGIAFQLTDDYLDATAENEQLGKPAGADSLAGKKNAVAFLGTEETRNRAIQYLNEAVEILKSVDADMTLVQRLAEECVHRQS
ncbi:MAG: polyprenyl synthetase family protein [Gammaproteobacteria bacterium]|nr:polyprenyl synthetase family protein [Gammaproteobacteria bacterium]MYF01812.1 polyprenyl synthetase family protein [Gammaproteobacteria bacterium]MYI77890.1 polyprenyl synthetase family protein [Gammaproteobacteria bacterium]